MLELSSLKFKVIHHFPYLPQREPKPAFWSKARIYRSVSELRPKEMNGNFGKEWKIAKYILVLSMQKRGKLPPFFSLLIHLIDSTKFNKNKKTLVTKIAWLKFYFSQKFWDWSLQLQHIERLVKPKKSLSFESFIPNLAKWQSGNGSSAKY